TGELEQDSDLGLTTLLPPAVAGNYIALLGQDGALRLWDNASRSWVWIYDSEQPTLTLHGQSQPLIIDNMVVAGFANGRLVGFNLLTGELRWAHRLSDPRGSTDLQRLVDVDAGPLLIDGRVYAAGFEGRLVEVMPESGDIRWETQQSVSANLVTDGRSLFVASRTGEVFAYDLRNKGIRWHQQGYAGRPITGLSVTGEGLVMTDRRGYAHVLSTLTGDTLGRINFRGSRHFTVPAATDSDRFYLQSMEGLITGNSIRLQQE
ncbi:MAG: PQQ-binding-like beta-propeller repeat protein, partial [Natronospirillum sp.]